MNLDDDVTRNRAETDVWDQDLHPGIATLHAFHQGRQLSLPALLLRPNANLGLTVGRAGQVIDAGEWNIVLCTDAIADLNLFRRGGQVLFPLYFYG